MEGPHVGEHNGGARRRRLRWRPDWLIRAAFLGMVAIVVATFTMSARDAHKDARRTLYSEGLIKDQHVIAGLQQSFAGHLHDIQFLRDTLVSQQSRGLRPDSATRAAFRAFLRTHPAVLAIAVEGAVPGQTLWSSGSAVRGGERFAPLTGEPGQAVGELHPAARGSGMTVAIRERIATESGLVLGYVVARFMLSNLPGLQAGPRGSTVMLSDAKAGDIAMWEAGRWRPPAATIGTPVGFAQLMFQEFPWAARVQWTRAAVERLFWAKERPYAIIAAVLIILLLAMDELLQIGYVRIRQLRRYQEAAVRIQKELVGIEDPDGLSHVVVDAVVRDAGAIGAYMAVPQPGSEWFKIAAVCADTRPLEEALEGLSSSMDVQRFPEGHGIAGRCYRERVPLGPVDPRKDTAMSRIQMQAMPLRRVRGVMAYPVLAGQAAEPAAILVIASGSRHYFPPALRDLLAQVVQSIGVALTQARHHRDIMQALSWNHTLLQNASDGIHVIDESGRLVEVSSQFCAMLGYAREELLGQFPSFWDAALSTAEIAALIKMQFSNKVPVKFETTHRRKDGSVFDVEVSGRPAVVGGKSLFFNSSRDISERKTLEAQLRNHAAAAQRVAEFNRLLSEANEAIGQIRDEDALLKALCELTTKHAHAMLAWIARPDADGWFEAVASAGRTGYLGEVRLSATADRPEGACVEGRAWRTGRSSYDFSLATNEEMALWANQITAYGLRGAASLPVHRGGRLWAVFSVYQGNEYVFDDALEKILRDLVHDISFGLDQIDIARGEREANAFTMVLLDSMASGVVVMRYPERSIERFNRRLLEIYGTSSAEEVAEHYRLQSFLSSVDRERLGKLIVSVLRDGVGVARDIAYHRSDGNIVYTDVEGRHLGMIGKTERIVWTHVDVTERHRQEEAIRALSAERATLLANTTAGIALVRYPERVFVEANQAFADILGYERADGIIGRATTFIYPNAAENHRMTELARTVIAQGKGGMRDLEIVSRHENAKIFVDISGQRIESGDVAHPVVVWTSVDVTERHRLGEELVRQAFSDKLTGLPNRRALDEELEKSMIRARRHERLLAVVMMDLDGFKPINDTFGHETGDYVLRTLGGRLQSGLRASDFVSRLGGDEFVLLLEDCRSLDEVVQVLEDVGEIVRKPIELADGTYVEISCSAGACVYPLQDVANPDALIRYADQALYQSKEHKADRLRFWAIYGEPTPRRLSNVQRRLREDGLVVYYQPILDNRSRRVVGVEALSRLCDADGTIMAPAAFLPHLDQDDLFELSERVLAQSLEDLRHLDDLGHNLWVSVNVDPSSVSERLVMRLHPIISRSGVAPSRIVLEILEGSNFLEQSTALKHLLDLKALGVRIALDDVGSAYSSLLRLKELPIDEVKLDQEFVRTLEEDPSGILFTATVLDLARDLGKTMVVEGVETDDILDAVTVLTVPFLQGYQIAMPMRLDDLVAFLAQPVPDVRRHPTSLLGLYAQQLVYDRTVRRAIRHDATIISRMILSDARACRLHGHMQRLGIADSSAMWPLHERYHKALAAQEALSLAEPGIEWPEVHAAQEAFLQAILREYRSSRSVIAYT